MNYEQKIEYRETVLLACIDKKGCINIRKTAKRLCWPRQKVVAVGKLLERKGIVEKYGYEIKGTFYLQGFSIRNF